ncbi:hypothetical protein D3C81_1591920 [compost metagenome]
MGVIMISVGQVTNTNSPSAVRIPALSFDNPIADAADRDTVRGEEICSFMSSQSSPSTSISPSIPESIDTLHGKRKCTGRQIDLIEGFINFGELADSRDRRIVLVIPPQSNPEIFIFETEAKQIGGHCK